MKNSLSSATAALLLVMLPLAPAVAQDMTASGPVVTPICLAPTTVEAAPSGVDPL